MAALEPVGLAYRIPDAARAIGLSQTTVWRLVSEGDLPSFKVAGRRLILRSELEAFILRAAGHQGASDGRSVEGPQSAQI